MAEHEHGTMKIEAQQKTFEGFMRLMVRSVIVIFIVLIFLAIFRT